MTTTQRASRDASPRYLTPEQVCELVPGLTTNGLAQLRFKGRGPRFLKPTPRKVLYRESDVLSWVEGSERTITSGASA